MYAKNNLLKELASWPIEKQWVMMKFTANSINSNAIAPNSTASVSISIAKVINSIANGTNLM